MSDRHLTGILIVDDQPNWRQVLSDILEHEGYRVQCVSSANDAAVSLNRFPFHLVIVDMRLVEVYGFGVQGLNILKDARKRGCKTIAITGFVLPGLREKAHEMGIDFFVMKESGFEIKQFRDLVSSLIGNG